MGRFEVQGVISSSTGEPLVQLRQLDDEDNEIIGFQVSPMDAREIAQNIVEAAANAIYEAALIAWVKDRDPDNGEVVGITLISAVREFRADKWGFPDRPEDWRPQE